MTNLNEKLSFERMRYDWGHWCVLRAIVRGEPRSASYSAYYEEASRVAVQELTGGYPYTDHVMLMVKRVVVPGFEKRAEIGVVATPGLFFYLPATAKPTRQDWIMELAQKEVRKQVKAIIPYRIVRYYNVMDVDEYRMTNGRLIYYRARVEESQVGGSN